MGDSQKTSAQDQSQSPMKARNEGVKEIIDKQRPGGENRNLRSASLNDSEGFTVRYKADRWLCGFPGTAAIHIRLFVRWAGTLVEECSSCPISNLYLEAEPTQRDAKVRDVFGLY